MNERFTIIHRFYEAFQEKDYSTMQSCYHPQATFTDPAFPDLNADEVKAMWQMLLTASSDLHIEFSNVKLNENSGSCHWEAWYTFSGTGRKVHNVIDASFILKDGLIFRHEDTFDFWRWSRQALGMSGVILGWSTFLQKKVQSTARRKLHRFRELPRN